MTYAAPVITDSATDWRTVVGGGVKVGLITAIGVAVFAGLSRVLTGPAESIVQSALVLIGGSVFAFLPSLFLRPRDVDSIAWVALIGLLGALAFTVINAILLRPLGVYHWTWDAIGGGSGFWYIPVWWMGSAFLAWLGAWVVATGRQDGDPQVTAAAVRSAGLGLLLGGILLIAGIVSSPPAGFALGFTVGLIFHVPLAGVLRKG